MDGVHVGDEVSGLGLLGQSAGEQLVVVQVVDDEEETLEAGVGLGEKLVVVLQLSEGNIGELGEELLSGRVQFKVPSSYLIVNNRAIESIIRRLLNSLEEDLGWDVGIVADLVLVRLTDELNVAGGQGGFAA